MKRLLIGIVIAVALLGIGYGAMNLLAPYLERRQRAQPEQTPTAVALAPAVRHSVVLVEARCAAMLDEDALALLREAERRRRVERRRMEVVPSL